MRITLLKKVPDYFGDNFIKLHLPGIANMLVFKSCAPNLIKLVKTNEDSDIDKAINTVAKQIKREVKAHKNMKPG